MHIPSSFQRNDGNLHSVIRHVVHLAIPHYILFVACSVIGRALLHCTCYLGIRRLSTMPEEVSICATGTGVAEDSSGSRYSSQVVLVVVGRVHRFRFGEYDLGRLLLPLRV